jgi:flagellar assembly factor FliW
MGSPCPASPEDRIRLNTRFGDFEADSRNLLSFPSGLPGFEQCRRFVLLSAMDAAPLQVLMSVDGPPASFLTLDPRLVLPDALPAAASDNQRLGVGAGDALLWLAWVTINDRGAAFANLRAPIVINPADMTG